MREDPETALPRLEAAWMAAWVASDRATCASILADDFVLSSARGVLMSKEEWLASLDWIVAQRFEWEEVRVRPFGDVAVVHSRTNQQATVRDQDWSGRFLMTDVWVWRDGRWQVVARQGTGPFPIT
jgi:ketosteroid isomerase-like protein